MKTSEVDVTILKRRIEALEASTEAAFSDALDLFLARGLGVVTDEELGALELALEADLGGGTADPQITALADVAWDKMWEIATDEERLLLFP